MNKQYEINDKDFTKIKEFVHKRKKDSELYKQRGGFREEDLWVGAFAEIAAYNYLREKGKDVSYPDFAIYDKKDKSYAADLFDGSKFYHIKGQSKRSQKLYGHSWLLQRYDKIVKKSIKNHCLVLCNVDVENRTVEIVGTPTLNSIHRTESFGECSYFAFRKTKVALYLKQLKENINNIWSV